MRRAPAFWWTERPTWASRLLAPAGEVYGAVAARRMNRPGVRLGVPVVCVGNLVAGGAGKTPTAMALAKLLRAHGFAPAFVSRGYGRRSEDGGAVLRVDAARDTADRVGDEPLLLTRHAPTFVSADRPRAARKAAAEGANVVLLDDGLQNPSLAKRFALAVVDGERGIGNARCIPAGPLRAPLDAQWPHVSAVCIVGPGAAGSRAAALARAAGKPVWPARLQPEPAALDGLRGHRLLAFAGIGHPPKFFGTLRANGLDLAATRAYPDHHRYTDTDLATLQREATRLGAELVTTEKDAMRLPSGFPARSLPVELAFDDETAVSAAFRAVLTLPA